MKALRLLAALGVALSMAACTYVERERAPRSTVVQPTPSTQPPATVRPGY